jgi:hypothetical protein
MLVPWRCGICGDAAALPLGERSASGNSEPVDGSPDSPGLSREAFCPVTYEREWPMALGEYDVRVTDVGKQLPKEQFVSLKTLAKQWDCSRTTVTRLLEQAGVKAYYFGCGRTGLKRYLKHDIDSFLSRVETH